MQISFLTFSPLLLHTIIAVDAFPCYCQQLHLCRPQRLMQLLPGQSATIAEINQFFFYTIVAESTRYQVNLLPFWVKYTHSRAKLLLLRLISHFLAATAKSTCYWIFQVKLLLFLTLALCQLYLKIAFSNCLHNYLILNFFLTWFLILIPWLLI